MQVNLDFESEQDMIEKFRIGLALQPIAVALFANSPFVEGKPSGMLSTRGEEAARGLGDAVVGEGARKGFG
jgi:glutamate--cysteine ligase